MAVKTPVSLRRRLIARKYGLKNVWWIAKACREADVPFYVACALFEKESGGRNVYGHDVGGALSGFEKPVNRYNWEVFRWLVLDQGHTSNGVGPAQITYAGPKRSNGTRDGGFFRQMEAEGLRPWVAYDNMLFGLRLLAAHKDAEGSWTAAGRRYNGAEAYGVDLDRKIQVWKQRFEQK